MRCIALLVLGVLSGFAGLGSGCPVTCTRRRTLRGNGSRISELFDVRFALRSTRLFVRWKDKTADE